MAAKISPKIPFAALVENVRKLRDTMSGFRNRAFSTAVARLIIMRDSKLAAKRIAAVSKPRTARSPSAVELKKRTTSLRLIAHKERSR
jgi:hypothetical protein